MKSAVACLVLIPLAGAPIEKLAPPESAVVKVTAGKSSVGSGVVVGRGGPFAYILTAAHVVEKAKHAQVVLFSANNMAAPARVVPKAEVVARDADKDLALLRFLAGKKDPPMLKICPPDRLPRGKKLAVTLVGYKRGVAPQSIRSQGSAIKLVRKRGARGVLTWQVGISPDRGMSGGPLLDKNGFVIGICSGRANGKGYYTHIDEIHTFLNRNVFEWLYEKK